jgi:transposase
MSLRAAAAAGSVSPCTAHRWWHRWLVASPQARASGAWLQDRSSRPHRQPRLVAGELAATICAVREATGWGPRLIAGATGVAHQTVWKVLRRHGISRRPQREREAANRYQWPCPAICCTWMSAATRGCGGQGSGRPAIAPNRVATG